MKQHSISSNPIEHLDDAPELTEADLSLAVYKVAGQAVTKADCSNPHGQAYANRESVLP